MSMRFEIDRRGALAALAAGTVAGCVNRPMATDPTLSPGLDMLAQAGGRRFGTAISSTPRWPDAGSIQNPRYTRIVLGECGLVVPENEMKWQVVRPNAETYDFARLDQIVAWAQANGLEIRGHTLLWHRPQWFPNWLNNYDFGANPVKEAERLLTEHVRTVTRRYKGVISSYDVVNEAIDHERNAPIETSLSRAMGSPEAVLDISFHTAREELPQGQLVYNDYMSWEPQHRAHCADVLRLLEGFRKRGAPVDALGIQSHIEMFSIDPATGVGPYAEAEWRNFLDEVVGMGYRLLITEFDVKDRALPADIPLRDAKVADYAKRYFNLMLEYGEHLDDILAWGMVDGQNWLQQFAPARRHDGLEVRGAPYASDYQSKPLRDAIAASLSA